MVAINRARWQEAQTFERSWWLSARDQHQTEIEKSFYVAQLLRISEGRPKASVIDIGCGPLSLLLRVPVAKGAALDPLNFADLEESYADAGLRRIWKTGEELSPEDGHFDEAWIYNCLQHVIDPLLVLKNAMQVADLVRIFEWVFIKPYLGHPHELTPQMLQSPFEAEGWRVLLGGTNYIDMPGLNGNYFVGIFSKRKT